jgi:hypothetical protein
MPPKHIEHGKTHGYVGEKPKPKRKPKVYEGSKFIDTYRHDRNKAILSDLLLSNGSRLAIEEYNSSYELKMINDDSTGID